MKTRMLQKVGTLILPLTALFLEFFPHGAVLNFADLGEDGTFHTVRVTCSYFDLLPFGYGNFGPLLTGLLTCVLLLLMVLFFILQKRPLLKAAGAVLSVSVVASLMPLCFGLSYFSVIGAAISLILIAERVLLILCRGRQDETVSAREERNRSS